MQIPAGLLFLVLLIVVGLVAYGEYKERHGRKQGKREAEAIELARRMPLIQQEIKLRDEYWLSVLRVHSLPAPQPVVLQLGDGVTVQKRTPRGKAGQ